MNVVQFDRTQQALALLQQAITLLGSEVKGGVLTKSDRLLRRTEVEARTGLRKTAIYGRIKAGSFPASVELSPGVVRWSESSIDAWVAAQGRAL